MFVNTHLKNSLSKFKIDVSNYFNSHLGRLTFRNNNPSRRKREILDRLTDTSGHRSKHGSMKSEGFLVKQNKLLRLC